jgi:hypothetical protein
MHSITFIVAVTLSSQVVMRTAANAKRDVTRAGIPGPDLIFAVMLASTLGT